MEKINQVGIVSDIQTDSAGRLHQPDAQDFRHRLSSLLGTPVKGAPISSQGGASEGVRFSKHAIDRLISRGISVTDDLKEVITKGLEMAAQKGGKESLIITEYGSFIVNVPNKTVVTALGNNSSHVFTGIDSAVIV